MRRYRSILVSFLIPTTGFFIPTTGFAQLEKPVETSVIGAGWASNSINVVPFRKASLVTHKGMQYTAYYDNSHSVVLAKRKLGSAKWERSVTQYKGNVFDAHNSISIIIDGDGYLHVAWDHHSYANHLTPLNYCRSIAPGVLRLSNKLGMSGLNEDMVTYPEFYQLPDGDLLFFFRDGVSGNGNIVLNRYSVETKKWTQIQNAFIDGEDLRNPYWQIAVDNKGVIHLSWTWRESPDAASNHDICYAKSADGGLTWSRSNGEKYALPIKEATAEYVVKIPQNSELINQTSMTTDSSGNPYIATYWKEKDDNAPQYHLLYLRNNSWVNLNTRFRKNDFRLSGGGTKRIPISRPQLLTWEKNDRISAGILFRDEERGNKASIAICQDTDDPVWKCFDLDPSDLGAWEPTFDTGLWEIKKILNLLIQKVQQENNDGKPMTGLPQNLSVLQWTPQQ